MEAPYDASSTTTTTTTRGSSSGEGLFASPSHRSSQVDPLAMEEIAAVASGNNKVSNNNRNNKAITIAANNSHSSVTTSPASLSHTVPPGVSPNPKKRPVARTKRSTQRQALPTVLLGAALLAATLKMILYQPQYLPSSHVEEHSPLLIDHDSWKLPANRQSSSSIPASTDRKSPPSPTGSSNSTTVQPPPQKGSSPSSRSSQISVVPANLTGRAPLHESSNLPQDNPLLRILHQAGVNLTATPPTELPNWTAWQDLYGSEPYPLVLGLETCATYRQQVPEDRRYTAVAGLFNTGTNAMMFHLQHNVRIRHRWQVPWGKHRVPSKRLLHVAPGMQEVVQEDCLPIVMVRDPLAWMQSMCKQPYAAHWKHTREHCPNLVANSHDAEKFKLSPNDTLAVRVDFDRDDVHTWDSLVHFWNDWNRQYVVADYPRLIIRFEDLLVWGPWVVQLIAECAGVDMADKFVFQTERSKHHGSGTDYLHAVMKTGNASARLKQLTADDLAYAQQHLDQHLMQLFHYAVPTTQSEFDAGRTR